jgi:hypothetical protein
MKTWKICKDFNIELCDTCLGQSSIRYCCYIQDWLNWFNSNTLPEIIKELHYRIDKYPEDNLYCFKALEIYDPKLLEDFNKLMILI